MNGIGFYLKLDKGKKMGCIYSDFNGKCTMCDEDDIESRPNGSDKECNCSVEDDPVPSDNCDYYESDSTCFRCGADFNADEECTCDD
jgi:hypothetical protein